MIDKPVTQAQFSAFEKRMETRFKSLAYGVEANASDIQEINNRFDTIETRLDAMDNKLDKVIAALSKN